MITDEQAEAAADWLRDNAGRIAQDRANRIALEEGRKALKASLMAQHLDKPVSAQEREAYASDRYKEFLDGLKEAIERDERNKMHIVAANARIEVWRSQSANMRGKL